VAIANDVGLLSSWNTFVNIQGLRSLYQLNDKTTGALHLYLKDVALAQEVQARLRKVMEKEGYGVMENDPRAFWMKFEVVNRENWTGQKLDITNWEDEISFMKWTVDALTLLSVFLTTVLIIIIGVGVMNIMWITIRERTREIGTLRAIGMQRTGVLQMFVIEGFLLGLFGTLVGTTVGVLTSLGANAAHISLPVAAQLFVMTDHLILTPTVGWAVFAVGFITTILTGISLIPSFLAARMKPISAMSHFG
jgi:ABC-type lipoprotein release transport system permease subunit